MADGAGCARLLAVAVGAAMIALAAYHAFGTAGDLAPMSLAALLFRLLLIALGAGVIVVAIERPRK